MKITVQHSTRYRYDFPVILELSLQVDDAR